MSDTASFGALQASVRRLQALIYVLVVAVVALSIAVIARVFFTDGAVRAQRIQLVSEHGDVLAELAVRDGAPGLYLSDGSGAERAALMHAPDGTGLYIMDSDGVTRIGIAQFSHGGGGVALHGQDSRGAAVLYFKDEGSLKFYDSDGTMTQQVPSAEHVADP